MIVAAIIAVAILICLLLSAFFAGSESAVVSANRFWLRNRADEGDSSAQKALDMLANTQRLLVVVLIGNNVGHVLLALFFKSFVIELWPEQAEKIAFLGVRWHDVLGLGLLILTPIIVVFAEIAPKALFRAHADSYVQSLRPAIAIFSWLFRPAAWAVERLTSLGERTDMAREISRDDILDLVSGEEAPRETNLTEAEKAAEIAKEALEPEEAAIESLPADSDERRMIQNIIELHETTTGEIMTPLVELVPIRIGQTDLAGVKAIAQSSGFSRFPVYRDRIVNITGYIDIYQVLRAEGDNAMRRIEDFVEKAYYVPETKRVDDLLEEFLQLRLKLAVVVDEYGGCVGWITREDILEEIVGELEDELDLPASPVRELEAGMYLIDARIEIEELNAALGSKFEDEDWETLAGLMLHRFGCIPSPGDSVDLNEDWNATVTEMQNLRIQQARLTRRKPEPPQTPEHQS